MLACIWFATENSTDKGFTTCEVCLQPFTGTFALEMAVLYVQATGAAVGLDENKTLELKREVLSVMNLAENYLKPDPLRASRLAAFCIDSLMKIFADSDKSSADSQSILAMLVDCTELMAVTLIARNRDGEKGHDMMWHVKEYRERKRTSQDPGAVLRTCLGTLASKMRQHRYADVVKALEPTVASGAEHLEVNQLLAVAWSGLGLHEEAVKLQRKTAVTMLRVLGAEHPRTVTAQRSLAVYLYLQNSGGSREEAAKIEREYVVRDVRTFQRPVRSRARSGVRAV